MWNLLDPDSHLARATSSPEIPTFHIPTQSMYRPVSKPGGRSRRDGDPSLDGLRLSRSSGAAAGRASEAGQQRSGKAKNKGRAQTVTDSSVVPLHYPTQSWKWKDAREELGALVHVSNTSPRIPTLGS